MQRVLGTVATGASSQTDDSLRRHFDDKGREARPRDVQMQSLLEAKKKSRLFWIHRKLTSARLEMLYESIDPYGTHVYRTKNRLQRVRSGFVGSDFVFLENDPRVVGVYRAFDDPVSILKIF